MTAKQEELLQNARGALQQQRLPEAERLLRQLLVSAPDQYDALQMLGAACMRQNKFDDGIAALKRACHIHHEDPRALFNLGSAYAMAERWSEANASFQMAIQLDPNYQKAREALGHAVQKMAEATRTSSEGGGLNIYCHNHPDVMSVDRCRQCGAWLCAECERMDYGTAFCERCYQEVVARRDHVASKRQEAHKASAQAEKSAKSAGGIRGLFRRKD